MASDDKRPRASGNHVLLASAAVTLAAVAAAVGLTRVGKGSASQPRRPPSVQWQPAFPRPQHNALQGVWGAGLRVVAVGRAGAIVTSQDLGLTWRVRPSGTSEDLQSVWGDGRGVLVAVGNNATILRSDDWGEQWTKRPFTAPTALAADASTSDSAAPAGVFSRQEAQLGSLTELWGDPTSGELWASGRFGLLAHSRDRGLTWRAVQTDSTSDLYAIWSDGRGTVIAAGRNGLLLKSTDRGGRFTPRATNTRSTLLSLREDGDNLVAVGWFGTVIQSSDRGESWTPVATSTQEDLTTVAPMGSTLVAVGMRGAAIARRNNGWTTLANDVTETLGGFWSDGRVGIAVGTEGAIYRVLDDGRRWEPRHTRVQGSILAIAGRGAMRWAVGRAGLILRSTDDGRTWTHSFHESRADILSVFALDERELFATNAAQKVLHSTDGGEHFTESQPPDGSRGLSAVWAASATDVYVAGPSGLIIKSTDRGQTWRLLNTGVGEDFFALWGLNANEVFAVGTHGYILRSTDQGVSWQRMINMSTRDLTNIAGDAQGRLFAVGKEGEVLTSHDHGVHWRIARVGLPPTASMFGACVAGDVWYAAGLGATLLRSTDHGQSWQRESPFTNDDLTSLWCDRRDQPLLAGYAGVLLTRGVLE
jgi:photosystem II stability/assembly factor-like uncharacterized protein